MRNFAPQQIITYRIQLYVIEVKLAEALPLYAPPTSILRALSTVGFLELETTQLSLDVLSKS